MLLGPCKGFHASIVVGKIGGVSVYELQLMFAALIQ